MDILLQLAQPFVDKFLIDLSPARMLESVVLLAIIWGKLAPHLTKIENRIAGLENAVRDGFNSGELRFDKIEQRVETLERNKPLPT